MKIITFGQIIQCNKKIKDAELSYKIHLKDACGKQSCWIETYESGTRDQKLLLEVIISEFKAYGIELEFSEDKSVFWVSY